MFPARKGADVDLVSLCGESGEVPEPEGKLDAAAKAKANGPTGEVLDWDAVDWRAVEEDVRRLRQRIFTASKAGDLKKVRSLQKLMLRSRSNVLLSVRRVTQDNAGRNTAGVDGEVMTTSYGRARLVEWMLNQTEPWQARPVRRVFIPKSNGRRPLGIPVIVDRVLQARVKNALEPEWEARFEPKSYGFRPGRGCHDAIEAIYQVVKGRSPKRLWVLDADLAAAFDRLDHNHLLDQLGEFPGRGMVRDWLTAGVIEKDQFTSTEAGVPQGGVISPLLLNIALHGMETAAGVRYFRRARGTGNIETAPDCPTLVRYADDLVALCHSRRQAEAVKARLVQWLAPRGLAFNEDKTQIVHLADGFDFLGFNVRRYHHKLVLIKPSKAAVRRIRLRLRTEMRVLRGSNVSAVLKKLAPIVRGWAAYYRTEVSSEVFSALDDYVWKLTYRWARHSHPNKSRWWVVDRYYGSSTRPSATGGYSATATAAPTSPSSLGRRSSGMRWSPGPPHPTIRRSTTTGRSVVASSRRHRSAPRSDTFSVFNTAGAPIAAGSCSTPISNHKARPNGNSGCGSRWSRSGNGASPPCRTASPTIVVSPIPSADAGLLPAQQEDQHFCPP